VGIGVSVLLLAVGAVLAFAVHVVSNGFNINTVGVILMVVGGIGLLAALVIAGSGAGWYGGGVRRTTYVDDGVAPAARRRRVVRDTYVD
jgi:hypothetical protein